MISAVIPREFTLGKSLGRGTFGEVFLLQDPQNVDKELFAVKRIQLDGIDIEKVFGFFSYVVIYPKT